MALEIFKVQLTLIGGQQFRLVPQTIQFFLAVEIFGGGNFF